MKFSFARGALALMATLTLASCGGGKATFPINVTVSGVSYDGLVLTTNGQDLPIHYTGDPTKPATIDAVFPNQLEYGEVYSVVPKSYPKHQSCNPATTYPAGLPISGTAGQLARIQINYECTINAYPLVATVKGLRGSGLTLANGSAAAPVSVSPLLDTNNQPTGADIKDLTLFSVTFNTTYGVTILSQPKDQTCTVSGGANGSGAGTMDQAAEDFQQDGKSKPGVYNLVVQCS